MLTSEPAVAGLLPPSGGECNWEGTPRGDVERVPSVLSKAKGMADESLAHGKNASRSARRLHEGFSW